MGDSQNNMLSENSQAHKCTQADEQITNCNTYNKLSFSHRREDILTHYVAEPRGQCVCACVCSVVSDSL